MAAAAEMQEMTIAEAKALGYQFDSSFVRQA